MSIMQVSTSDSNLFPAEKCFAQLAEKLNILSPLPELPRIKAILENNMPQRVERFAPRLSNPENPTQWLSLILKTSFLIQLWSSDNHPLLVGLNVTGSLDSAMEKLEMIQSPEFYLARKELAIAHHWFVIIPGFPPVSPTRDELLDALYAQLAIEAECGIIQFKETWR